MCNRAILKKGYCADSRDFWGPFWLWRILLVFARETSKFWNLGIFDPDFWRAELKVVGCTLPHYVPRDMSVWTDDDNLFPHTRLLRKQNSSICNNNLQTPKLKSHFRNNLSSGNCRVVKEGQRVEQHLFDNTAITIMCFSLHQITWCLRFVLVFHTPFWNWTFSLKIQVWS